MYILYPYLLCKEREKYGIGIDFLVFSFYQVTKENKNREKRFDVCKLVRFQAMVFKELKGVRRVSGLARVFSFFSYIFEKRKPLFIVPLYNG
jgi:hypothetical protein